MTLTKASPVTVTYESPATGESAKRHAESMLAFHADAIKAVRESLADEDCALLTPTLKHKVMRIGRTLGVALADNRYGGLTVTSDEEGGAEIVVDSAGAQKRLAIRVNTNLQVNVALITTRYVSRSGWMRDIYDLKAYVGWLLKDEMNAETRRPNPAS